MWMLLAAALWDVLIGTLICRAVIQGKSYYNLSSRPRVDEDAGSISVVIPARNEAANIERCVHSLAAQTYGPARLQILVVDDHSHDATAELVRKLAETHPQVRLLSCPRLPAGWTGKSHACWHGALAAEGDWLCFLDADTVAEPALLSSAVACAREQKLGMLSLAPLQILGSFFERLLIPVGALTVAFTQDLRRVNQANPDQVSANGQFLLFPRVVYFGVGGHRAVRGEICEDRALARRVKQAGSRFLLLAGERLILVRMYTSLSGLWEGFSKNVTEMLGGIERTWTIALGMLAVALTAYAGPSAAWFFGPPRYASLAAVLWALGSAALASIHVATAVRFRAPFWYGLLFPLGYMLGAGIALNGIRERLAGNVSWKGRIYAQPEAKRAD